MIILLYIIAAYIIFASVNLLILIKYRRRRGSKEIEKVRESAYYVAPKTRHRSRRISSSRY